MRGKSLKYIKEFLKNIVNDDFYMAEKNLKEIINEKLKKRMFLYMDLDNKKRLKKKEK